MNFNDQTDNTETNKISTADMHKNSGIYVALGDSIAQGYRLADPGEQSYPALIAKEHGLSLSNYGKLGITSAQLLEAIENDEYILSDAELITVSIGSNDMFGPVMVIMGRVFEIPQNIGVSIVNLEHAFRNWVSVDSPDRILMRLNAVKNIARDSQEIYSACIEFTDVNLPKIADAIRKRNRHAQLIFTNMYNPYNNSTAMFRAFNGVESSLEMTDLFKPYVEFANRSINDGENYKIADIGSALDDPKYMNASFNANNRQTLSIDPHPNPAGHIVIKNAVEKVYIPKTGNN